MITKKVRLKNFVSYEDSNYVEFERGTTLIIGPNGSGKTALIDGIMYSLFGENLRSKRLEDLLTINSNKPLEVELFFEEGGKIYRVMRTWDKKKGSSAHLYWVKEGRDVLIAEGRTSVDGKIREIIGMDTNTAINTTYFKQGEIEGLLSQERSKRKEIIDRLLGIKDFENAYSLMKDIIYKVEKIRDDMEKNEKEVSKNLENIKERMNDLEKNIEEERERIREIEGKIAKLEERKEGLEKKVGDMEEKRMRSEEIRREIEKLNGLIEEKERIIREYEDFKREMEKEYGDIGEARRRAEKIGLLEELKGVRNDIENLEKDRSSLEKDKERVEDITKGVKEEYKGEMEEDTGKIRDSYNEIRVKIVEKKRDVERKKGRMKEIEKKIKELVPEGYDYEGYLSHVEGEITNLRSAKRGMDEELGRIEGDIKRHEEWIDSIKDENKCPLCGRDFDEQHSREDVRNRLLSLINEGKGRMEEVRAERSEIERKISDLERIDRFLRAIPIDEYNRLAYEIEEIDRELNSLKVEKEKIESKALRLYNELLKRIGKIDGEIEGLMKREEEIGKELEEIPEDIQGEIDKLRALEKKIQEWNIKRENCKRARKEKEKLVAERESKTQELKEIGYDEEEHKKLEKEFKKVMGSIEKLKGERETIEKSIKDGERNLKELDKRKKEEEKKLGEIKEKEERAEKMQSDLKSIRNGFHKDGIPTMIREGAIPRIENYATENISKFNFGITDIKIDSDFSIKVYKGSQALSIDQLSGGQKTAVAIAIRLAIAKCLSNRLTTVIMDEPTAHLDDERRFELVEFFNTFLEDPESLAQLIIVTHHREFESIADSIYRVNLINDRSVIREEAES